MTAMLEWGQDYTEEYPVKKLSSVHSAFRKNSDAFFSFLCYSQTLKLIKFNFPHDSKHKSKDKSIFPPTYCKYHIYIHTESQFSVGAWQWFQPLSLTLKLAQLDLRSPPVLLCRISQIQTLNGPHSGTCTDLFWLVLVLCLGHCHNRRSTLTSAWCPESSEQVFIIVCVLIWETSTKPDDDPPCFTDLSIQAKELNLFFITPKNLDSHGPSHLCSNLSCQKGLISEDGGLSGRFFHHHTGNLKRCVICQVSSNQILPQADRIKL